MQEIIDLIQSIDFQDSGNQVGLISSAFILISGFINLLFSSRAPKRKNEDQLQAPENIIADSAPEKVTPKIQKVSWADRLSKGLSLTRDGVWGKLENIFVGKKLDDESLEQIEELLYSSDMSGEIVDDIVDNFKKEISKEDANFNQFKTWTFEYLENKFAPIQKKLSPELYEKTAQKLRVFMIVGVNGAGKTTTIGKLATKLKSSGAKVVVGACDTFRAAAVEQLEVWCDRAGVEMVKAKSGNDPSGVAYDTLSKAIAMDADYCLLDTAGRLHNHSNLMDELAKTKRVLSKQIEDAPHETLLVIDSITGQNALRQASEFNKALDLSGIILTKCDGSSKAGNAISIASSLNVPIAYIGVGEDVDDLEVFKTKEYLSALLGV